MLLKEKIIILLIKTEDNDKNNCKKIIFSFRMQRPAEVYVTSSDYDISRVERSSTVFVDLNKCTKGIDGAFQGFRKSCQSNVR